MSEEHEVSFKVSDLTFKGSPNANLNSFELMRLALKRKGVNLDEVKFSTGRDDDDVQWLIAKGHAL